MPSAIIFYECIALSGKIDIRYKEEIFYNGGGETLAQVAQRGSGGPVPGNVQGQVGWHSEHLGLVEDIPAKCREVGLDDFYRSVPTQSVL